MKKAVKICKIKIIDILKVVFDSKRAGNSKYPAIMTNKGYIKRGNIANGIPTNNSCENPLIGL